jgi:DNA-binding transcriptional MocR family regulator
VSFKLVKQVIRSEQQSPAHKLVLIVIADHTNETKSGTAWPAIDTIAAYVGLKRRQVQRILRELENTGQIQVQKRDAFKGTNRYRILSTRVSPTTPVGVTHDTSEVSFMTKRGVTHDTQVHKEQITTKAGGAPAPQGRGATALETHDEQNVAPVAQAFGGDTPQCQQHKTIDWECKTCYGWQQEQWRKEKESWILRNQKSSAQ